ncbi:isoquinoline 1-oxidoreductase [Novosphingobium nitrogenifigens DSM 19370]|uniref:Isoquinoline 1-oxidoreductase n=1 Tax=Novosphingobium nitrogenifigens DSM 19370 TaxID=983920 RepID=F1Z7U8_9SPHN|nr:molybdopterin cofactor-binding domain-containing protein [Novosphingobium nitrogenifigens]EGD59277.1 isoquinoline 1-oxidoreductase [Novosphingobium nitrogenifigens DSM 19370]
MITATRRGVLSATGVLTGALMVPVAIGASRTRAATPAAVAPNAWLSVDGEGHVGVALPKTEMGQGIMTAIVMLAAEELAVRPGDVKVSIPDGDAARFAPITQETGGSTSIRELWQPLREAAATARVALIAVAAKKWGVPAGECAAHEGTIVHRTSNRSLPYAALVADAAAAPLPKDAPVLPTSSYAVVGKPFRRLDGDAKARGKVEYGIDVILPGMRYATLAQSPVFGGKLAGVDEAAARAVPGVLGVIKGDDVVYVLATNTWAARQGLAAAKPQWHADASRTIVNQAEIDANVTAGLAKPGFVAATSGDLDKVRQGAARTFTGTYHQPFLAHATMEPANCVAQVKDGHCEVWTGTQIPSQARSVIATRLGLPMEKVAIHNRTMGGGFGRRLEPDMIERCVDLAKQVPFPVKLVWTREEDVAHDWYRPVYADRFNIGLAADGRILSWEHKIAGSSIMARLLGDKFTGVDDDAVDGAINPLYGADARKVTFQQVESLVPTSWWRGVGGLRSTFAIESMIDEIAHSLGKDPIAYRLSQISDPRAHAVLETVRAQSGWGEKTAAGIGRGVSVLHVWDTYMAAVAEVSVDSDKQITVRKVTVAVDCGQAVNPSGILAQIDSGVNFGGSAALFGEITIAGGQVEQSNFHDYRVLRMNEAPVIHATIIESSEKPGGMGEPPNAIIFPALANAVFAATGKRLRSLPLQKELQKA